MVSLACNGLLHNVMPSVGAMAQETLADDADRCVKLASEVVAVEGLAALVFNVDDPGDGKVVAGHTLPGCGTRRTKPSVSPARRIGDLGARYVPKPSSYLATQARSPAPQRAV